MSFNLIVEGLFKIIRRFRWLVLTDKGFDSANLAPFLQLFRVFSVLLQSQQADLSSVVIIELVLCLAIGCMRRTIRLLG